MILEDKKGCNVKQLYKEYSFYYVNETLGDSHVQLRKFDTYENALDFYKSIELIQC